MANKTADEILKRCFADYFLTDNDDDEGRYRARTEASRQLFEATLEIIGEDDESATEDWDLSTNDDRQCTNCGMWRIYEGEEVQCECDIRNWLRKQQRTKARAFYGITETKEEGKR